MATKKKAFEKAKKKLKKDDSRLSDLDKKKAFGKKKK